MAYKAKPYSHEYEKYLKSDYKSNKPLTLESADILNRDSLVDDAYEVHMGKDSAGNIHKYHSRFRDIILCNSDEGFYWKNKRTGKKLRDENDPDSVEADWKRWYDKCKSIGCLESYEDWSAFLTGVLMYKNIQRDRLDDEFINYDRYR